MSGKDSMIEDAQQNDDPSDRDALDAYLLLHDDSFETVLHEMGPDLDYVVDSQLIAGV